MKVKLTDLAQRFHYEGDQEYWTELMNEEYVGIITGHSKSKKVNDERWNLPNSNYKMAYEIRFTISGQGDDEHISEYFFPENFELALREAPKDDIEWLDRVKHNFQWAR